MSTHPGLDYSTDHPTLGSMHGYDFICRYLGAGLFAKGMNYNEAASLSANGHSIVSNWEGTERAALNGRTQGISDASRAATYHLACGGNPTAPIYFSCDFDPRPLTASQWASVEAYFDGVASVIGHKRVGVYGGYAMIEGMQEKASWFWQTYAWSGGKWSNLAHIRQTHNGVSWGGGEVDLDTSMSDNYGQWKVVQTMGQPLTDGDESKLSDVDYTLLHAQDPAHPGVAIPFHVWATQIMGMVEALTVQVQTLTGTVQALQASGGVSGTTGVLHVTGDLTVAS